MFGRINFITERVCANMFYTTCTHEEVLAILRWLRVRMLLDLPFDGGAYPLKFDILFHKYFFENWQIASCRITCEMDHCRMILPLKSVCDFN